MIDIAIDKIESKPCGRQSECHDATTIECQNVSADHEL